jgi:putative hydrolase of the HAD superfamily
MACTYSADVTVSAILLDAGGVLIFPQPDVMLPPLLSAGVSPDLDTLRKAHYRAMAVQDRPAGPEPASETWWRDYLLTYVGACGVADGGCEELAKDMAQAIAGFGWTHVGPGVTEALRAIAGLGVPLGVVSNSDGTVQAELHRLGVCSVNDGAGVRVGVVMDSAVVGIAKPDPGIFRLALEALGVRADETVLHIGDSLRYDVAGAIAAGIRPVHLDPHGFCPAPEGHTHITSLADIPALLYTA